MIFETHAHYDDDAFDVDREELLNKLLFNGIDKVVNVGASFEGCKKSLELSQKYDFVYAALGIHPDEISDLNTDTLQWIKKNSVNKKVVAIGEIGLDYYNPDNSYEDKPSKTMQIEGFEKQLSLAKELKLPVVIHSREAAKDTQDILKNANMTEFGGIIHCYSYSKESARFYLDNGFYIGVGGVLTFKNAKKLKEVVEYVPMSSLVLETDSPYLAPVPNRGKRNSSLNLGYVADEIANIKGISREEVECITYENALKVYRLSN